MYSVIFGYNEGGLGGQGLEKAWFYRITSHNIYLLLDMCTPCLMIAFYTFHRFKYPDGLNHVLFHYGDGRKQVYKYLYGMLHFGNKIGSEGQTLVYPIEVRDAVRTRFPGDTQGKNDEQYQRDGPKVLN